MNVDHIYQLQRDDAFARQFSATEYSTFIAMPFTNRGGYPEKQIKELLGRVHEEAKKLLGTDTSRKRKTFSKPFRTDDEGTGTFVITDAIIRHILDSHFFLGDLTGCNFGVVLEAGIALALKPSERVLLITQDGSHSLHFDLRTSKVCEYQEAAISEDSGKSFVKLIATELVKAANCFEEEAGKYIKLLSTQLTPDGISALRIYGTLWDGCNVGDDNPSIWEDSAEKHDPKRFGGCSGKVAFHNAVRELSARRLFWTDYKAGQNSSPDTYGIHSTNLGWRVIEELWPARKQPPAAPTGPNLT